MRILGIDPGTARTGYGLIDVKNGQAAAVGFGCIKTDKDERKEKRLQILYEELSEVIEKYKPDILSQELLFFCKNAKTAILVGEARGVILLAASQNHLPVWEYTPMQVKDSIAGSGKASKSEVKEMVKLHLQMETFRGNDDAADALAIALCHLFHDSTGEIR